uniref:Uncharacterized protein n=1 Tax=Solanum tuberosum TaxID=4113 RepID=M1DUR2_SOLTU
MTERLERNYYLMLEWNRKEKGTLEGIGGEMKEEGENTCKKTTKAKINSVWHTVWCSVPRPKGENPIWGVMRGATRQGLEDWNASQAR